MCQNLNRESLGFDLFINIDRMKLLWDILNKFTLLERLENNVSLFSKVNRTNQYWIKYKWIILFKFKNSYLVLIK